MDAHEPTPAPPPASPPPAAPPQRPAASPRRPGPAPVQLDTPGPPDTAALRDTALPDPVLRDPALPATVLRDPALKLPEPAPPGAAPAPPGAAWAARSAYRMVTGLARACHPLPTAAVTLFATALAAAAGQDLAGVLPVAAAVLAGQLSVGWCNDAVDARRDRAARRRDKPVVSGVVSEGAVRAASLAALALCVPLSLACGAAAGAVHLLAVAAAWAYDLGVKGTALSWLPYAVGFAALPAFVVLGVPGGPAPPWWLPAAGALLGVGAHLGNALPDIAADRATGVHGWPQRLGPRRTRLLTPLPLVLASAVIAAGSPDALGAAGLTVAALTAAAGTAYGRHRPRVPFMAAIAVAGLDVAMLVWRGAALF
ncbi:UbiA family prenyltransferase [Streptomyces sp. SudanB25_2051]|uniref:UbiA family prenyltransferase n=1 Tax=Streptomyces sp. SudanB25_2051 TaxID=3035275 RepID=UPI003F566C54